MAGKKKKTDDSDADDRTEDEIRSEALAALFKGANKNFGAGTLMYSDDEKLIQPPRISTGILPLDYALGGGIPVGRISLFFGHKSTAKTTNILRTLGNAQKMCSSCWTSLSLKSDGGSCECGQKRQTIILWLDVEGVWDPAWSANFMTLDETVIISQPGSAEQAIDLAHAALKSHVDIIVIDSIAFLAPQTEQDRSSSEDTMALQARLMGKAIRKFVATTNELGKDGRRPTIILTNQIRSKVGLVFGDPTTVPGGFAAGFATSVEIKTSSGKYEMDDVTGQPLSVANSAKVVKNKTAKPNMEASWEVCMMKSSVKDLGGIMDESWAFDMGEKAGLVKVAPQKIEWNSHTFRGRSLLEKYWMENREEYSMFRNQLMPIVLAI